MSSDPTTAADESTVERIANDRWARRLSDAARECCDAIGASAQTRDLAVTFATFASRQPYTFSKTKGGVAGGCVYLASLLAHDDECTQAAIGDALDVTDNTVRRNYKHLARAYAAEGPEGPRRKRVSSALVVLGDPEGEWGDTA